MKQAALFDAPPKGPGVRKARAVKPPAKAFAPLAGPVFTPELLSLAGDVTHLLSGSERRGAGWWFTPSQLPRVLAIDPGAHTSWAIIDPAGGVEAGSLTRDESALSADWAHAIALLIRRFREFAHPSIVVVEDAFLHVANPNVQSTMSLARRIGAVVALASCAELPCWRVLSSEWQRKTIGHLARDPGKARAIELARELTGLDLASDHEADAVLLAVFARGRWAKLQKAKG